MTGHPNILDTVAEKIEALTAQIRRLSPDDRRRLIDEVALAFGNFPATPAPTPPTVDERIMGLGDGMDELEDRIEYLERVVSKMSTAMRQMAGIVLREY